MPHIDDGVLHAYLDGALGALADAGALPEGMTTSDVITHLEQCPDCHSRLEMERVTRERAGSVLRDAGPQLVHIPPLVSTPIRQRRGWLPLAWAASLVMAAGAGWWANQMAVPYASQQAIMESAGRARSPMPERETGANVEQPRAPSVDAPTAFDAVPAAAAPAAGDRGGAAAAPAAGALAEGAAAGAPAAGDRAAAAVTTPAAPSLDTVRQTLAREAAVRNQDAERARLAARAADAHSETSRPAPVPAPPPAIRLESVVTKVQPAMRSALGFNAGVAPAPQDELLRSFMARDSAGQVVWREQSRQQDERAEVFAWRDAEDVSFDVAMELGFRIGRVRQRLDTGEQIEVITWELQQTGLDALVVTAEPRDSTRAADERAAHADKATLPAAERLTLVSERALADGRIERLYAAGSRHIIVRTPSAVTADDVIERLHVSGA